MQSAPLRDDEQASLDALLRLGVLDTAPEPEFNALVHAASALCGVPVSLISLVDADRQWILANIGLPGVTETSRDIAFCAHAVRFEGLFEVPDTASDSRFADNPLVVDEPRIRFYAGAPISLSTGERVGSLCVMDRQPRSLDDRQRTGLRHLAVAAAAALESHRAKRLLQGTVREAHRTAMLLQHTADAVIGLSDEGLIVLWNPAATRMFGYVEAEMIGQTFAILTQSVNRQRQRDLLLALVDGQARTYDSVGIHRSGTPIALSITSVPDIDPSGRFLGATAFLRDTSDRDRAARALAMSEARLRTLLQTIPDMVSLKDREGVYLTCNVAFENFYGARTEDIVGKFDHDFMPPALAAYFRERDIELEDSGTRIDEAPVRSPTDGRRVILEVRKTPMRDDQGSLLGMLRLSRDITIRRQAEEELERHRHHLQELVDERTTALAQANEAAAAGHRANIQRLNSEREAQVQSSKLEAVGTLAAGIAHDFNNILASIVGYAELAGDSLPDGSDAKSSVSNVIRCSFRARDLVARMLDFARKRPCDPIPMDVVLQVREAIALLRPSLPPSIEIDFQNGLGTASAMILADPTQIMQVVMNLCINAAHAVENRGVIAVSLDRAGALPAAPREYAGGVCLTVEDRGSGMTREVLERIFDPFFTTKPPGEGSGLGLSVVYGIVQGLGGLVDVVSSVLPTECGTRFRVFLPAAAMIS